MQIKLLKELDKERLQNIIIKMSEDISKDQLEKLEKLIEESTHQTSVRKDTPVPVRMSQEFVAEKMNQMEEWMRQIDEGELYLDAEEYEDYSSDYWDRDLITDLNFP